MTDLSKLTAISAQNETVQGFVRDMTRAALRRGSGVCVMIARGLMGSPINGVGGCLITLQSDVLKPQCGREGYEEVPLRASSCGSCMNRGTQPSVCQRNSRRRLRRSHFATVEYRNVRRDIFSHPFCLLFISGSAKTSRVHQVH